MDSAKLTGIFRKEKSPSSNRGSKPPTLDQVQEKLSALEQEKTSWESEMKRKDETIADQKKQIEELQSKLRAMEDKAQHEDISLLDEPMTQNDTPSENMNAKNKASLGDRGTPLATDNYAKEAAASQYACAPGASDSPDPPEEYSICASDVDNEDDGGYENNGGYVEVCFWYLRTHTCSLLLKDPVQIHLKCKNNNKNTHTLFHAPDTPDPPDVYSICASDVDDEDHSGTKIMIVMSRCVFDICVLVHVPSSTDLFEKSTFPRKNTEFD